MNSDYDSMFRIMRILVMYDLPMQNQRERAIYSVFRRFLLKHGFYMIQESIYCCLAKNPDFVTRMMKKIAENCPEEGNVRCLTITEHQYRKIKIFVGAVSEQEKIVNPDPIIEI